MCCTVRIDGYVVEGHLQAADDVQSLKDKPNVVGISVRRMPIASACMDGPAIEGRQDPYDVLLVKHAGSVDVFQSHR